MGKGVVHSSEELTTDSHGKFECPAYVRYFYSASNWVAIVVQYEGYCPAAFLGIYGEDTNDGVKISRIISKGSADKAELKPDDVIAEFAGQKVSNMITLKGIINKYSVGDEVNLKILRNNKQIEISVVMLANPEEEAQGEQHAYDQLLKVGEKDAYREVQLKNGTTLKLSLLAE